MCNRRGYSLIELIFALTLCALLAGMAVPSVAHARHVLAVRAARAELAGLVALARSIAISTGGASLVLDTTGGSAWIEDPEGRRVGDPHPIAGRHSVMLESDRTSPVRIRFDGLGIGRLANSVLRVRRGDATATLTISAYGRVRQ